MPDDFRCQPWRTFLETLHPDGMGRLDQLAAPDIHYHDPFIDARGLPNVRRVFARVFEDIEDPRYTFTHTACDGDTCFLRWHFTCRPMSIRRGLPWICDGITELHFDPQGRVLAHWEHWDAGEQVYEKLPVLRTIIRLVKKRISGWPG